MESCISGEERKGRVVVGKSQADVAVDVNNSQKHVSGILCMCILI